MCDDGHWKQHGEDASDPGKFLDFSWRPIRCTMPESKVREVE
jgi:hypothetical protein